MGLAISIRLRGRLACRVSRSGAAGGRCVGVGHDGEVLVLARTRYKFDCGQEEEEQARGVKSVFEKNLQQ